MTGSLKIGGDDPGWIQLSQVARSDVGLCASDVVEGNVGLTLESSFEVPGRATVTQQNDSGTAQDRTSDSDS